MTRLSQRFKAGCNNSQTMSPLPLVFVYLQILQKKTKNTSPFHAPSTFLSQPVSNKFCRCPNPHKREKEGETHRDTHTQEMHTRNTRRRNKG